MVYGWTWLQKKKNKFRALKLLVECAKFTPPLPKFTLSGRARCCAVAEVYLEYGQDHYDMAVDELLESVSRDEAKCNRR